MGLLEDYITLKVCGNPIVNKAVPSVPDLTVGNIETWLFSCTGFPPLPNGKGGAS